MWVLREFGINDPSSNFSLCEVSVVKTKQLPDQMTGLSDKISLNARYVSPTMCHYIVVLM